MRKGYGNLSEAPCLTRYVLIRSRVLQNDW